jgi:hypothetical protein
MVRRAPLSCNIAQAAFRVSLHALGYVEPWSLTNPPERVITTGSKVLSQDATSRFQMAELGLPRRIFRKVLSLNRPVAGAARGVSSG